MDDLIRIGRFSEREINLISLDIDKCKHKKHAAEVYSPEKSPKKNDYRSGSVYFPKMIEIKNSVNIYYSVFIENYFKTNINFTKFVPEVQYAFYDVGNEFKTHKDTIYDKRVVRSFTMSINLSHEDSYEGGEFYLISPKGNKIFLNKKRGSFIIFPAFLKHRACAVKKGIREALVVWSLDKQENVRRLNDNYESYFMKK